MAHALIDVAADAGDVDLVATFCHEFPIGVLCEMLGVDAQDRALLGDWTDSVSSASARCLQTSSNPRSSRPAKVSARSSFGR